VRLETIEHLFLMAQFWRTLAQKTTIIRKKRPSLTANKPLILYYNPLI
jgi:hypothetical protein